MAGVQTDDCTWHSDIESLRLGQGLSTEARTSPSSAIATIRAQDRGFHSSIKQSMHMTRLWCNICHSPLAQWMEWSDQLTHKLGPAENLKHRGEVWSHTKRTAAPIDWNQSHYPEFQKTSSPYAEDLLIFHHARWKLWHASSRCSVLGICPLTKVVCTNHWLSQTGRSDIRLSHFSFLLLHLWTAAVLSLLLLEGQKKIANAEDCRAETMHSFLST